MFKGAVLMFIALTISQIANSAILPLPVDFEENLIYQGLILVFGLILFAILTMFI